MPTVTIRIPAKSTQVVAGHLGYGIDMLADVRLDLLAGCLNAMEHNDTDPGERRMNADQCRDALLREVLHSWTPSELVEAKIPGVLQMWDEIQEVRKIIGDDGTHGGPAQVLARKLEDMADQLAALQSIPQGVEVPELDPGANPHQRNIDNPGSFGWSLNRAYRDGYNEARKSTRLVPTPPQAAPGPVVIRDPDEDDWDAFGFQQGTKAEVLRVWNRALATCKESLQVPHPLQPEERRVGPDEVVVPRSAAEYAILAFDWIECPDSEHYEASRAFHDALRTSAQAPGQRGEG